MKISIIVVTYNEVDYIDQTLGSIYSQIGVDDFEVIIGDDGSNDGTLEKIHNWKKLYPNRTRSFVMERQGNLSNVIASLRVSEVIKRGLALASGDYVCLIAGDDFYCSNQYLLKQLQNLEAKDNKKCIASVCCYEKYWDECVREKQMNYFVSSNRLSSKVYLGGHMYMHLSAFLFRNIFKNNAHILQKLHFIDDVGLTFLFGNNGNYCGIQDVLFSYRQRPKSIMTKNDPNDNRLCSMLLYAELYDGKFWKYPLAFRSRMLGAIVSLYKERKKLLDAKYDKYFNLGDKISFFRHSVFRGEISFWKKIVILARIAWYYCCYAPYRVIVKAEYLRKN